MCIVQGKVKVKSAAQWCWQKINETEKEKTSIFLLSIVENFRIDSSFQDENSTAKEIVRVVRQSEDNYQVIRWNSKTKFTNEIDRFCFLFSASGEWKLSSYVWLDVQGSASSITNNKSQNWLVKDYGLQNWFWIEERLKLIADYRF